jgi:hypothetical protein
VITGFGVVFFRVVGVKPEEFADCLFLGEDTDVFNGVIIVETSLRVTVSRDSVDVDNCGLFLFGVTVDFVPVVETVEEIANCLFAEKRSDEH